MREEAHPATTGPIDLNQVEAVINRPHVIEAVEGGGQ